MLIYILVFIIFFVLAIAAVIYHDTHNFVVLYYDIYTDKIDGDYSFALLSDLHGYTYGDGNQRLIDALEKASPDAVLCAGDMLTGHNINGEIRYQAGLHLLSELARKYPVYMANGNHERKLHDYKLYFGDIYDQYIEMLREAGVTVINNDSIAIKDKNIRITGLDLELDYFQKVIKKKMEADHLETLLGKSSKDEFQVLIAHNPQYFEEYVGWGADLAVSGHVHGGIIRLPFLGGVISPSIALFPKYDGGLYEMNGRHMLLSRGLGTHSIHVRLFNPAEADIIRVHGNK